jgi:transcriptional regulator with XRE-family HTH domain
MQPGERIKLLRENKDLSQEEFGKALGYSQKFVSDIEIGKAKPPRDFLIKLKEVFNMSSDYVLYGIGSENDTDRQILPPRVEEEKLEWQIDPDRRERRLAENASKRTLIDKVVKIVDSKNETVNKALEANLEAFLYALRLDDSDLSLGDKGGD